MSSTQLLPYLFGIANNTPMNLQNPTGNPSQDLGALAAQNRASSELLFRYQQEAEVQKNTQSILNTINQARNGLHEAAANNITKGHQIAASIR